ncbi:hypothetical protein ACFV80_02995 [Streptomyces sp. NPDC059862]|uniref:hypothetical protein n=1 Tax=Streptomyces sp. NPDC059862 TaxID=3346975 RepID=UPI00366063F5
MVRVLISPSYGSPETRRHWADTIDRQVDFTDPRHDSLLAADQRARLQALHPEGRARFWGATPAHDKKFADVVTGDVVLFTGRNKVRAIGEVGAIFRNRAFADLLWPPRVGGPSWHTVYSLVDLVPADIPYEELNAAIGYRPTHNFPGQMVLRGVKARSVLDDFMITPSVEEPTRDADPVRIAALEELRTHRTGYRRSRRLIVVDRREAQLVREYRRFLTDRGRTARRFFCPSGISDMYVETAEGAEVIEAKSAADHSHVRQALAQLLDYAPHSPSPAHLLTALFPQPPDPEDVGFLHRYGIDCVHRDPSHGFQRLPASSERRALMRGVWSGKPPVPAAR